jgi:hypothetical protein
MMDKTISVINRHKKISIFFTISTLIFSTIIIGLVFGFFPYQIFQPKIPIDDLKPLTFDNRTVYTYKNNAQRTIPLSVFNYDSDTQNKTQVTLVAYIISARSNKSASIFINEHNLYFNNIASNF